MHQAADKVSALQGLCMAACRCQGAQHADGKGRTCLMRPGVPTTTCGGSFLSSSLFFLMSMPPKKLATFTAGMYVEKRVNSWQICSVAKPGFRSHVLDRT